RSIPNRASAADATENRLEIHAAGTTSFKPDLFSSLLNADWHNHLSHGDIVRFRLPGAGRPVTERLEARPCLVLDIETVGTRRCAILIPAVSARRPASGARSVILFQRPEYRAAGLSGPTRFPIRSRLIVPLVDEGFVPVETTGTDTPVIGRLTGDAFERMNAERGRLHALRDIRADQERRHPQRRGPQRDRDFTVTRRGQRRLMVLSPTTAARRSS
ncbi:hypothetical protein, partial [Roseovarius sp. D0-M9]|uniref:hypothetical protein n=1 Tax=Roseovarius sp. D0-M9 TaxID=3127117 RepID=UPI00300F9E67